jgi:hypothetical protein
MTPLAQLWLPIVVSAVIVFVASSVIHMAPLWHRNDYPAPPDQDRVRDALRPLAIPPGDYMLPRARSTEEMKSPEFQEKMRQGPVMIMTVIPSGPVTMGKSLGLWFGFVLVVSFFAAYVAGRALPVGADYRSAFRFAGVAAFLSYSVALWPMSIWYRRSWSLTFKQTLDGLVYALLTAGTFGALWPE